MAPALPLLPGGDHRLHAVPDPSGDRARPAILVLRPSGMDDGRLAIETVRSGRSVVFNASELDPELGQRLVDFTCGGVTAIDGHSHRLGEAVFLFAPALARVKAGEPAGL